MNANLITVWAFSHIVFACSAQNCAELESRLFTAADDTNKVIILDNLVKCLNDVDGVKALEYNHQALDLSEKLHYNHGLILSLIRVKGPLMRNGQYDELLQRISRGTQLCKEENDLFWWIRYQYSLADCYTRIGRSEEAVAIASEALDLAKKRNDDKVIPLLLTLISKYYFVSGEYDLAQQYQFQSLEFAEKINRPIAVLGALADISIVYNYMHTDSAAFFTYTLKGIQVSESLGEMVSRSTLYNNLGDYYTFLGINDSALISYKKAYEFAKNVKYDKNQAHAAIHLAYLYAVKGDQQQAANFNTEALNLTESLTDVNIRAEIWNTSGEISMLQDHYPEALASFQKIIEKQDEGVVLPMLFLALDRASECAENSGKLSLALGYSKSARVLNDSILNLKRINAVNTIERRHAVLQQETALELSKQDAELKRLEIQKKDLELLRKRAAIEELELSQKLLENENLNKSYLIRQSEDSLLTQQIIFTSERNAAAIKEQLKELESNKQLNRLLWITGILAALFANMLFFFFLARSRQQLKLRLAESEKVRAIEQLRRETAQDVHDLVGRDLTLMGLEAQFGASAPNLADADLRKSLAQISDRTRLTASHLSSMVLAINPETDHFSSVQDAFKEICVESFAQNKVQLQLNFPQSAMDAKYLLKPDAKRQLSLILIESINNILKYAQADFVKISFQISGPNQYLLEVSDNGIGFDSNYAFKPSQMGLKGMKTRAEKIGAHFQVSSTPGSGATIKVQGSF